METWLIEAIDGANEEVLVAVQELSLPRIAQALIAAQKRGIEIRLVADPGFASRPFSEVLDLLGVSLPNHT